MFCREFGIPKTANIKNKFTAYLYICGSVCHHHGPLVRSGPDSMQLVYICYCPPYVFRLTMWLCGSVYYPALLFRYALFRVLRGFKGVWGWCGLVLVACFACFIGSSCVWEVRRFWGLWRFCPLFYPFCPSFYLFAPRFTSLSSILYLWSLRSQFVSVTLWFDLSSSLYSLFYSLFYAYFFSLFCCCFFFPFGYLRHKKRGSIWVPLYCCYATSNCCVNDISTFIDTLVLYPAYVHIS